jgi:hypothetical protein
VTEWAGLGNVAEEILEAVQQALAVCLDRSLHERRWPDRTPSLASLNLHGPQAAGQSIFTQGFHRATLTRWWLAKRRLLRHDETKQGGGLRGAPS